MIEAPRQLGYSDVPLATDLAPSQESVIQSLGQKHEGGVIVDIILVGGILVLVDESEIHAVVLDDVQAGEVPVILVCSYGLVLVVLIRYAFPVGVSLGAGLIHQSLHAPDHPNRWVMDPTPRLPERHLGIESDAGAAIGVSHHSQRDVGSDGVGPILQFLNRDTVGLQFLVRRQLRVRIVARHPEPDLQQGHQPHVTIIVGVQLTFLIGIITRVERLLLADLIQRDHIDVLDLPVVITRWPVQDIVGVPQAVGIRGTELELHVSQLAITQAAQLQLERLLDAHGNRLG